MKRTTKTPTEEGKDRKAETEAKTGKKRRDPHVTGAEGLAPPAQSSLGRMTTKVQLPSRVITPEAREASQEVKSNFSVPFMAICQVDTPVVKRVPNSQRSAFATAWGRLLEEAVESRQESAWSQFFMFPKCVLWTPVRGGKRLSKKVNMADLVRMRITRWSTGDKESLWKETVERSKRPLTPVSEKPQREESDQEKLEARVIRALRMGDVRKALQMLNSAPIVAKTEATLERLRKLHPVGDDPAPAPRQETPRFTEDVVRAALSSFGPCSAAGLFGYKPLLLQQCMRAESFLFSRALTTAARSRVAVLRAF